MFVDVHVGVVLMLFWWTWRESACVWGKCWLESLKLVGKAIFFKTLWSSFVLIMVVGHHNFRNATVQSPVVYMY